jgi:hypothetical protein
MNYRAIFKQEITMNENVSIQESLDALYNWVVGEEYCGWDIYDALNSNFVKKACLGSPLLEILLTQTNKYSPFNFRPHVGVQKGVDMKGLGLFSQAFSKMYAISGEEKYKEEIIKINSYFEKESVISQYKNHCWSHYFPYTSADKNILSPKVPDVITTCNVIKALVDSHLILEDENIKDMARSAYEFVVNDLLNKSNDGLSYLMYSPIDTQKMVINASALGLETISKLMTLYPDDNEMKKVADELCDFIIHSQKPDGLWAYSIYHSGKERIQTDFHQGFILDGLIEYLPYVKNDKKSELLESIDKGIRFYREKQFLNDGRCHFRYPYFYPTEVHTQAQGIITFSKYSEFDPEHLDFAEKIAQWTITNLQDESGYFYYYKHRFFKNKTPHMRWGQGWMMLALATYLEMR